MNVQKYLGWINLVVLLVGFVAAGVLYVHKIDEIDTKVTKMSDTVKQHNDLMIQHGWMQADPVSHPAAMRVEPAPEMNKAMPEELRQRRPLPAAPPEVNP